MRPGEPPQHETLADPRGADGPVSSLRIAARYTIGSLLGEGGMGEVRACKDVLLERDVALKAVRRDRRGRELDARFVREACVQAQLEHPGVVPVFEVGRDETGSAFFTMRKVSGITLDDVLAQHRLGKADAGVSRHRLLTAFAQVCLTVDYAHSRGVLHRDLKPANVMLGEFGEVYVLDWGLAKLTTGLDDLDVSSPVVTPHDGIHTVAGTTMGTPAYMAPEQLAGEPLDARADVFALGALLFEIVTLEPLLDEQTVALRLRRDHARWESRPSVRAPARAVPPEFDRICARATSFERDLRYPSARALHDAVEAYLRGERDLELRKREAQAHVARAKASLAVDRDVALAETNRALALAPDDPQALELLVELLAFRPVPTQAIRDEIEAEQVVRASKSQMRGAALFGVPWITLYPLLLLVQGVSSLWRALVPPLLWVVAACSMYVDNRRRSQAHVRYPMLLVMLAIASTSLLFGPFFALPALSTALVAIHVMAGARRHRPYTIAAGTLALLVPSLLAWTGIHDVYEFRSETTFLVHGVFRSGSGPLGVMPILVIFHLVLLVLAGGYFGEFRDDIEKVRLRNALFTWQLSKLLPSTSRFAVATSEPGLGGESAAADTELGFTPHDTAASMLLRSEGAGAPSDPFAIAGPRYMLLGPPPRDGELSVRRDRLIGRDVSIQVTRDTSRLGAETRVRARLDHPGIPPLYDVGADATEAWMTTRRISGMRLDALLVTDTKSERHRLLAAFAKVCLAVDYAHVQGVLHTELSPACIVLGDFGEVSVVGWERAQAVDPGAPLAFTSVPGTGPLRYRSPERAAGETIDARTDVFALGAILYEILALTPLFDADPILLALGRYDARPSARVPDIAPELDAICVQATAHAMADRTASARALHDAVEAYLARDGHEALRQTLADRHLARASRRIDRVLDEADERVREEALFELGRSLALAPDRHPILGQLSRLLASPPARVPPDVDEDVVNQIWTTGRRAAKDGALTFGVAWVVAYPIYLAAIGTRDLTVALGVAAAWLVAALVLLAQYRFLGARTRFPWAALAGMGAVGTTTLLLGPFVLAPAAVLGMTVGSLLGGRPAWRRVVIALALLGMTLPTIATGLGWLDACRFLETMPFTTVVMRGAIKHPPHALYACLTVAHLGMLLIAARHAARYRDVLVELESANRARQKQLSRLLS